MMGQSLFLGVDTTGPEKKTVLFLTVQLVMWTLMGISRDAFGITPKSVVKKVVKRNE
jgi:hypothetical protein